MWKSVGVDGELTHEQVVAGFAKWLTRTYAQMWYLQTDVKIRWYLQRRTALKAWASAEARNRLRSSYRPTWSVWAFHEYHFSESMMENKRRALRDPFWSRLFLHKQRVAGDPWFFARVPLLLEQEPAPFSTAQRLYCIFHDRLCIPFAWWRYEAAALYLGECLAKLDLHALAPSGELLRHWACELGLREEHPTIITKWTPGIGPSLDGFDEEAYRQSPIPNPALKHGYTQKLSNDVTALEGKEPIL
jgi:hypothetical protein